MKDVISVDRIFDTLNGSGAHACYCERSVDGGCKCALKDEYLVESKTLKDSPLGQDTSLDEFEGKTFRECAEIIVGNPKDKDWSDMQINALCRQHQAEIKKLFEQIRSEVIGSKEVYNLDNMEHHAVAYRNTLKVKQLEVLNRLELNNG